MKFLTAICSGVLLDSADLWIKLMPAGEVIADDGRKWTNPNSASVVDASGAQIDLVIDYEHQTDLAEKNGQPAPAAGWIKKLEARADGIWGLVEWTDKAKAHLSAKEYRYLSPTFMADKTKKVLRILRAALTNHPALHDLPALATQQENGTDTMNEEEYLALCQALGLDVGTSVADTLAAVKTSQVAVANAATARTALCAALDLGEDAKAEDITAAVTSLKTAPTTLAAAATPDPTQHVSLAAFQEQGAALKALQDNLAGSAATAAVEKAMAAGKITPASKEWALSLAVSDMGSFDAFIKTAPVVIEPGAVAAGTAPAPAMATVLDADQKAVCAAQGLSEADFLATLKAGDA